MIPADTSEEVWRLQMAAIAARSGDERMEGWVELNRAVARMEADGIRSLLGEPPPADD